MPARQRAGLAPEPGTLLNVHYAEKLLALFFLSFLAARFSARVFSGFFLSVRFVSCDLDMVGSRIH